jgi:hypothetical protein
MRIEGGFLMRVLIGFSLVVLMATVPAAFAEGGPDLDKNKSVVTGFYEATQSGDLSTLPSFFTDDYTIEDVGAMKDKRGATYRRRRRTLSSG